MLYHIHFTLPCGASHYSSELPSTDGGCWDTMEAAQTYLDAIQSSLAALGWAAEIENLDY